MTKSDNIKYKLQAIKTVNFSFSLPLKNIDKKTSFDIEYNVSPSVKFNISNDLILVIVKIKGRIKQTEEEVLYAENSFVYHASNLKTYLVKTEKSKTWKFIDARHDELITLLIGISVSTMRGVVYEKTKGTIFQNTPIPILDPSKFSSKK